MEDKGFFEKHPEMLIYLNNIGNGAGVDITQLKTLIILIADLSYKDGFIEGIKAIMHELVNSHIPGWAMALVTVTLAQRVCSWPYGVLMTLKNIY